MVLLSFNKVVANFRTDRAVNSDTPSDLAGRVTRANVIMTDLGAGNAGIDKDAKAGLRDLIVVHVCAICLDAETDAIVGDLVILDMDIREVIHADSDPLNS